MENQEITNFFGLIIFWKLLEKLLEIFKGMLVLYLISTKKAFQRKKKNFYRDI